MFGIKEKARANGRIIITDFRKLRAADFKAFEVEQRGMKDQLALVSVDGKVYLNLKHEGYDALADMWEILMQENRRTLLGYQKRYKKIFPHVKNFEDWGKMEGSAEDRVQALAVLMIPLELQRREIEIAYAGKVPQYPT